MLAVCFAASALLALIWWHYRLAQVQQLADAALQVAQGNQVRPLDQFRRDEWGYLAVAFNAMLEESSLRQTRTTQVIHRLESVLAAMVEGVIAVDRQQRILLANRAAGRLLGFDAGVAEGKKLIEVTRDRGLLEAIDEAITASRNVKRESVRYEIDSPRQRGRILSLRTGPLAGPLASGALLVLQDITELRRLEFLRQEFVANVSHELKTPLTSIKVYTETLQQGAVDDPHVNRDFLGQIATEADRLQDLILDLLQLARIESGHQELELEALSMRESVLASVAHYAAAAHAKAIEISVDEKSLDLSVWADREALRQILDNLIDNAIKYTSEGGRVECSWEPLDKDVRLAIRDTGEGIPAGALPRVFERFYRVDKSRSREIGSTGLGLSIVKHLVGNLNGTVTVESEPGVGSTFFVTLTAASPTADRRS